jgi:hypothetical protein
MFVELTCTCQAHFQMDAEDNDTAVWLLVNRFVNAHTSCSYMTSLETDETVSKRRVIRARSAPED